MGSYVPASTPGSDIGAGLSLAHSALGVAAALPRVIVLVSLSREASAQSTLTVSQAKKLTWRARGPTHD